MNFIIITILMILVTSCHSTKNENNYEEPIKIELLEDTTSFNQNEQTIRVINASSHWSIDFAYKGSQKGWCRIVNQSGNIARIECSENLSIESRDLTLVVNNRSQIAKTNITQLGTPSSDMASEWMELPAISPQSNELFISHYITLQYKHQRNYSMLFDKRNRIAYWVAYPLYRDVLEKNTDRSDTWKIDPKIPKRNQLSTTIAEYQPAYHRGHQIPSADRLCSEEANKQTFLYSNITPQRATFNQGVWQKLESMVRDYAYDSDTLYVVTGAILQTVDGGESIKYVADKNRVQAALPNYYYKVLLRLRGTTYDAIGFWFDHKKIYPNIKPTASDMRSINDIEKMTGYDFFKSLPKSIENSVESEFNPNMWDVIPYI